MLLALALLAPAGLGVIHFLMQGPPHGLSPLSNFSRFPRFPALALLVRPQLLNVERFHCIKVLYCKVGTCITSTRSQPIEHRSDWLVRSRSVPTAYGGM